MRPFAFLLLLAGCASGQTFDFEQTTAPWFVSRGIGSLGITHEAANVRLGVGALAFIYPISHGGDKISLKTSAGLAGITAIRFWIKTSADMGVSVGAVERWPGGGFYGAGFWSRKDEWQLIELSANDFMEQDYEPKYADADGKLDFDQVVEVNFCDSVGGWAYTWGVPSPFPWITDKVEGPRAIFLDDVEFVRGPSALRVPPRMTIDDFTESSRRSGLQWMPAGGADIRFTNASPLNEPALQIDYRRSDTLNTLFSRLLERNRFTGARELAFEIASDSDADLDISLIQHERWEHSGWKFSHRIHVRGRREPQHVSIPLADIKYDDAEPERSLAPALLSGLSILDITGPLTKRSGTNTLWLGNIRMVEAHSGSGETQAAETTK